MEPTTAGEATNEEVKQFLNLAMDKFSDAWTKGEWQAYFDLFADDFIFEFPAGPIAGRFSGKEATEKRDAWRRENEFDSRITNTGENLRLFAGNWIVSCFRSEGHLQGNPYKGVETVFMKAENGKIVEYRETIGGLLQP